MSDAVFCCSDRAADAAVYVLRALEPAEEAAFERHLQTCVVCRDEVLEFGRVADALAITPVEYVVGRRLSRSVHRELRRARHARPPIQPEMSPVSPARRPANTVTPTRWSDRLGLRPATAGLAGALATAALAVAGVFAVTGSHGPGSGHTIQASVKGVPGSAQVRISSDHAELVVHRFSPPAAGEIYEVWLRRTPGSQPRPTNALFSVTSNGEGVVEVPGNLRRVSEVLVTQEPAGGSSTPSGPPIVVARLS